MKHALVVIGSTCGIALPAASAHADFTGLSFANANADIMAIPNQSVPEGHNVWRIYASFDDPLDAFLNITVDLGASQQLYQNPFGGDGPPNPALFELPGFEFLAADTFVTHGVSQLPIDNLGFDPNFEMLPNGIIGGWFDSSPQTPTLPDGNGDILVIQLTLPVDTLVLGNLTIFYEDADNPGTATVGHGHLWPSPGALPLLAFAAMRSQRRRRPNAA